MSGAGLLVIVVGWVLAIGSAAGAQEAEEPEPVPVSVSEEPGVCTELGAFCERLMAWTGNEQFAETTAWLLSTPLKIAAIVLAAALVNRIARRSIRRIVAGLAEADMPTTLVSDDASRRSEQRAETIGALLRSTATSVIFAVSTVMVLENLGVSVVPLLASLGIAGLAVGFGAQTLIEDLISGMMLVIEDQLGIGDDVDVGVVAGTVERLTLRSTVILDSSGVRWYVPNSEIRRVANESQHKSRAKVQIGVAYGTDLPRAVQALHEAALELTSEERWHGGGVEDVPTPFVAELGPHGVVLEVHVVVDAANRGSLEKALRQRLVDAVAVSDIALPHQRLDVWLRPEAPSVVPT